MPSAIHYEASAHLPKLGWCATLDTVNDRLSIVHGKAVECREQWMVEGVWEGPFTAGAFHRGAHLFGSGVRLDGGSVHFVPSCALVDRLVYCRDDHRLLVSNSLVILLAMTGAHPDPLHDYRTEARALATGIDDYDTSFHIKHPTIPSFQQVFHKSIVVTSGELSLQRRIALRHFESFEAYRSMLSAHTAAICANAADPARRTRLDCFGTLSTGYDSTAVTAIVKQAGVERFFTYAGAWGKRSEEYDATAIAGAMGVETITLDGTPSEDPEDELRLIAGSPLGRQPPLLNMARYVERHCEAGLVFTGYQGGVMWNAEVPAEYLSTQMKRRDTSGLDLTELRLKSGFFNVAIPFLFASSIESIAAVSRLPEMTPWRLGNKYDRPIPRRIVETAGVPRHLFGFRKSGLLGSSSRPTDPRLRKQYLAALRLDHGMSLPFIYWRLGWDGLASRGLLKTANLLRSTGYFAAVERRARRAIQMLNEGDSWFGKTNFRVALYCWALQELSSNLAEACSASGKRSPSGSRQAIRFSTLA
jgi:hypothetical protein